MSASAAFGTDLASIFGGRRPCDASAMAARCGVDVVRLRPMWPAVIAATRFARRVRWIFGNRAASLECAEPRQKRWLTQRAGDDPVQVHFDLGRWNSAYARCDGRAREINVFAADGSAIAAMRLDDVDASLDELLWLLADDDQRCATAPSARVLRIATTRRHAFRLAGPGVARPLATGMLGEALVRAADAGLPLRLVLENAGGSVAWQPRTADVTRTAGNVAVCSAPGRMKFRDGAAAWAVALARTEASETTLEADGGDDTSWLTVSLAAATPLQRLAWRSICAVLAGG